MKELTEKLLKELGVSNDIITVLKADETPEDFDMDQAVSGYFGKRRDLLLNDSDFMKELKKKHNSEQYPAIINPINNALKNIAGMSAEDMEAFKGDDGHINTKKLITGAFERLQKAGSANVDAERQKLFDLQKQLDDQKASYEEQIKNVTSDFEGKIKQREVNSHFNKLANTLEYSIAREYAPGMLMHAVEKKYSMDFDESGNLVALNKDGSRANDGKNFLSLLDIMKSEAEQMKILKKSNGGGEHTPPAGNGGNPPPAGNKGNQQLSERAARLQKLAEEQNKK